MVSESKIRVVQGSPWNQRKQLIRSHPTFYLVQNLLSACDLPCQLECSMVLNPYAELSFPRSEARFTQQESP